MQIGLKRISSRTMQFECTLHNGRTTSAFYCGIVRSYLRTATSSREISASLQNAPKFVLYHPRPTDSNRLTSIVRISVCMRMNIKHIRTLTYKFKEFNIKSAIKLKTFCYVLNKFRVAGDCRQTILISVLETKCTFSYASLASKLFLDR